MSVFILKAFSLALLLCFGRKGWVSLDQKPAAVFSSSADRLVYTLRSCDTFSYRSTNLVAYFSICT